MVMLGFLLLATFLLSIYDLRRRSISNWITLPALSVGVILHFPGSPEIWVSSFILLLFGYLGGRRIGFGDVKLWLAYFWILPPSMAPVGVWTGFQVIFITSLIQVLYVRLRKLSSSQPSPAAWRVLLAVLAVFVKSYIGIHYA